MRPSPERQECDGKAPGRSAHEASSEALIADCGPKAPDSHDRQQAKDEYGLKPDLHNVEFMVKMVEDLQTYTVNHEHQHKWSPPPHPKPLARDRHQLKRKAEKRIPYAPETQSTKRQSGTPVASATQQKLRLSGKAADTSGSDVQEELSMHLCVPQRGRNPPASSLRLRQTPAGCISLQDPRTGARPGAGK